MTEEVPNGVPSSIIRIVIRELFGRYSYDLPKPDVMDDDLSRILVLYGDNGSGKTTVLDLIYHLLSPAGNAGHRNAIARIPFRQVSIFLSNGIVISAVRTGSEVVGPYSMSISRGSTILAQTDFDPDADKRASAAERDVRLQAFLDELKNLELDIYFLADDRRVRSDKLREDEPSSHIASSGQTFIFSATGEVRTIQEDGQQVQLQEAIDRATRFIQQQAISGSSLGAANSNTVYADVVKRIASSPIASVEESASADVEVLRDRIVTLDKRADQFARYGLVSPLDSRDLLGALEVKEAARVSIITNVLRPYLEGMEATLDALEPTLRLVDTFVESVNGFYVDKALSFSLRWGMRITAKDGTRLRPEQLSSGERQLLLLLCHTLYARDQASIFIIDEPELSLNVKWQRRLPGALLACTRGTAIQFIMATHSVELINGLSESVVKLVNQFHIDS
jgi:energy-coupling factor transporter ATP-binding protein EcfA2